MCSWQEICINVCVWARARVGLLYLKQSLAFEYIFARAMRERERGHPPRRTYDIFYTLSRVNNFACGSLLSVAHIVYPPLFSTCKSVKLSNYFISSSYPRARSRLLFKCAREVFMTVNIMMYTYIYEYSSIANVGALLNARISAQTTEYMGSIYQ